MNGELSAHAQQWLTGFAEGDGYVGTNSYGRPLVAFTQKFREPLDYISDIVPGGHLYNWKEGRWDLRYFGRYCYVLLETFIEHAVGQGFLDCIGSALNVPRVLKHLPTIEWLAGFWDAEGTSGNTPGIYIYQKECEVLEDIRRTFGGNVSPSGRVHMWYLYGRSAQGLAQLLIPRSHLSPKAEQLRRHTEGQTRIETRRLTRLYISNHPEIVEALKCKP